MALLNKQHKISDIPKQFSKIHHQNYLIIIAQGHHLDAIPIIEGLGFHFT
jgi:hypothetical protein